MEDVKTGRRDDDQEGRPGSRLFFTLPHRVCTSVYQHASFLPQIKQMQCAPKVVHINRFKTPSGRGLFTLLIVYALTCSIVSDDELCHLYMVWHG